MKSTTCILHWREMWATSTGSEIHIMTSPGSLVYILINHMRPPLEGMWDTSPGSVIYIKTSPGGPCIYLVSHASSPGGNEKRRQTSPGGVVYIFEHPLEAVYIFKCKEYKTIIKHSWPSASLTQVLLMKKRQPHLRIK